MTKTIPDREMISSTGTTDIPVVSVVMAVYNAELYLKATMDSLLAQTYRNFEAVIVNDGSTDSTSAILEEYAQRDSRIKHHYMQQNRGQVPCLNTGVELAKGTYIARLDGDDICLPTRFEEQVNYLHTHPEIAVVATLVDFIDENGNPAGYWEMDRKSVTPATIRKYILTDNCIAHPSVMGKAHFFKDYLYDVQQARKEDHDLWLRLLSDGEKIGKVDKVLLLYRIHDASITRSDALKMNVFMKRFDTKNLFLKKQWKRRKWGRFEWQVCLHMGIDLMMAMLKEVKKSVRHALSPKHS